MQETCADKKAVQVFLFSGPQRYMMLRRESVKHPKSALLSQGKAQNEREGEKVCPWQREEREYEIIGHTSYCNYCL